MSTRRAAFFSKTLLAPCRVVSPRVGECNVNERLRMYPERYFRLFLVCAAQTFFLLAGWVDPCRRYKQRTRRLDTGYVARSWMRVSISAS